MVWSWKTCHQKQIQMGSSVAADGALFDEFPWLSKGVDVVKWYVRVEKERRRSQLLSVRTCGVFVKNGYFAVVRIHERGGLHAITELENAINRFRYPVTTPSIIP